MIPSFEDFNPTLPQSSVRPDTCAAVSDTTLTFPFGVVSGWVRPESGVFPQLAVTPEGQVSVPAGSGYIVGPTGVVTPVTWEAQLINIPSTDERWNYFIAIGASGHASAVGADTPMAMARTSLVLGTATRIKSSVTVTTRPIEWKNSAYMPYDLAWANGEDVIAGDGFIASRTQPMGLDTLSRTVLYPGINANNLNNPNIGVVGASSVIHFAVVTGNGRVVEQTTSVPVGQYNPSGGNGVLVIADAAHKVTNIRLYRLNGLYILMYGQTLYDSLNEAVAAIGKEDFAAPAQLNRAELLGFISTYADVTRLTDVDRVRIVRSSHAVGGAAAGGAGGSNTYKGSIKFSELADVREYAVHSLDAPVTLGDYSMSYAYSRTTPIVGVANVQIVQMLYGTAVHTPDSRAIPWFYPYRTYSDVDGWGNWVTPDDGKYIAWLQDLESWDGAAFVNSLT